ncbi:hypothetical protein [Flavobacterium glaciei]|uniref:Uncharacterized protein n=1 Tax=Flavobacterium glaciei TaxID=386300 RepID=A0A562PMB1_9FLAO|nr:hypothetical protein [Flavobacterium glaciei]RDI51463.1 hypothetical protein DFR66_11386 [Flavobacterium glaciei]TWI45186.1 hypothetical protein IQ02_02388 [Flavobacterium glaciei]
MKYFSLKADTKGISNLLIMFVFILMSNVSVFGQSTQKLVDVSTIEVNSNSKKENVSAASSSNSMNFVLWFMGTKQGPNGTMSKENSSAKIKVITSGSAPNRLLIKAFLKKAVDTDSMVS